MESRFPRDESSVGASPAVSPGGPTSTEPRFDELETAYLAATAARDHVRATEILYTVATQRLEPPAAVSARDAAGIAPLYRAAKNGEVERVRFLLAARADPNAAADDDGWGPLHIAIMNHNSVVALELLQHAADPNARTDRQQTPLHAAAYHGKSFCLDALLRRGADPNAADIEGYTPLGLAVFCGSAQSVRLLLAGRAAADSQRDTRCGTPLMLAVSHNAREIVDALLHARADPCYASVPQSVCPGVTPLQRAAMLSDLTLVQRLLAAGAGASVNAADADGDTALRHACFRGQAAIVRALLAAGADPYVTNNDGVTALHSVLQTAAFPGLDSAVVARMLLTGAKAHARAAATAVSTDGETAVAQQRRARMQTSSVAPRGLKRHSATAAGVAEAVAVAEREWGAAPADAAAQIMSSSSCAPMQDEEDGKEDRK